MAPHLSTLAWKVPWMEEPGRLQSMGSLSQTRLSNFTFTFHFHVLEKEMTTHSSVLAWRIPGTGEPGGLPSMGSHRVGHDWSNLAKSAATVSTWKTYFHWIDLTKGSFPSKTRHEKHGSHQSTIRRKALSDLTLPLRTSSAAVTFSLATYYKS